MSMSESAAPRVAITRLPTGVPGLDEVLGGGLPEYSFTLLAGAPGTGKTTLAHQLLFSLASPERRALYFSVVGEPMLKVLRYQQQMAYFDPAKVGDSIRFLNLSDAVLTQSLDQEQAAPMRPPGRIVTGVPGLDALVGGGLPAGDAVLVSGASGTGKSVLTAQFIAAGVRQGEPGVIAVFEEHPQEYLRRAQRLGLDLEEMVRQGRLAVIYLRPLDLSPDETLLAIRTAVAHGGARPAAID